MNSDSYRLCINVHHDYCVVRPRPKKAEMDAESDLNMLDSLVVIIDIETDRQNNP